MEVPTMEAELVAIQTQGGFVPSKYLHGSLSEEPLAVGIVDIRGLAPASISQPKVTPKDLILIIDVSGSMSGVIPDVQQTVRQVVEVMSAQDRLAIVLFESSSRMLLPLQHVQYKPAMEEYIQQIKSGGGTNILSGLEKAVEVLKQAPPSPDPDRLSLLMLLSDGQDGRDPKEMAATLTEQLHAVKHAKTIVNSFGFTSNHDANTLTAVTGSGSYGTGMYYFLRLQEDISSSLGDCLGSIKSVSTSQIQVKGRALDSKQQVMSAWNVVAFSGLKDTSLEVESSDLAVLSANERHAFVFQCLPASRQTAPPQESPSFISFQVSYVDIASQCVVKKQVICPLPKADAQPDLHILTHLLRIRCGFNIQRICDVAMLEHLIPEMEEIHEYIMETLQHVQQQENSEHALFDEGILVSIERDLGEVLQKVQEMGTRLSSTLNCRFLQLAREHLTQRSASSASQLGSMSPYSTPEQLSMRLRFLSATSSEDPTAIKAKVPLQDPTLMLSEEDVKNREAMDEISCYISLETWRESQLGIGLLVRPRTSRERYRGLVPRVEIVEDYVSAEAYNQGVRGMVMNLNSKDMLNRDDEEQEAKYQALKSSVRGRINAWLPLYINETNWKFAKPWCNSAFSIIATQFSDLFRPEHALTVCSKLMIQTVVKCLIEDSCLSDKTIQMFCDIHRLFLQVMKEDPAIKRMAEEKLKNFIEKPSNRCRAVTPDLGDLIMYVTITDAVSWEELKEAYVLEMFRRCALHTGNLHLMKLSSIDELMNAWMEGSSGGKVTLFNVAFLRTIARPKGQTTQDVMDMYDRGWGRLPQDKLKQLKQETNRILNDVKSLPELIETLLGETLPHEAIAELILWSFDNKLESSLNKSAVLPRTGGERVALWRERHLLWKESLENPPPVLQFWAQPPIPKKKQLPQQAVSIADLLHRIRESPEDKSVHAVSVACSCQRCRYEKWRQAKLLEWRAEKAASSSNVPAPPVNEQQEGLYFFVGHLRSDQTEQSLHKFFSDFGTVEEVHIVKDIKTGKSRRYGFVRFQDLLRDYTCLADIQLQLRKIESPIIVDHVRRSDPNFVPRYLGGGVKKPRKVKIHGYCNLLESFQQS